MGWYVTVDSIYEINHHCEIHATVKERDNGNELRSYPYHVSYADVQDMTLAQMVEDVTNFAAECASEAAAIDDLQQYIGQTIQLTV